MPLSVRGQGTNRPRLSRRAQLKFKQNKIYKKKEIQYINKFKKINITEQLLRGYPELLCKFQIHFALQDLAFPDNCACEALVSLAHL